MHPYISPLLAGLLVVATIPLVACGGGKANESRVESVIGSGFVLLSAASAPADTVGKDGDVFLNSATGQVYGPKDGGAWPASTLTLTGPAGPAGPEGPAGYSAGSVLIVGISRPQRSVGRDGDFYVDISSYLVYRPKALGEWPEEVTYLDGAQGADDDDGADGPVGVTGASVPQGPASAPNAGALSASYSIYNSTPGGKTPTYLKPDSRTNTSGAAGVVATSSCDVANFNIHWIGPLMSDTSQSYTFDVLRSNPAVDGSSPGTLLSPQLQCKINALVQHCSVTTPVKVSKDDVLQVRVVGDLEFTALANEKLLLGSLVCKSAKRSGRSEATEP